MKSINLEDLKNVAGGTAGTETAIGTVLKENQAAVCGMGTAKPALPAGMSTENIRTVKAQCPGCGKKTMFYIGSGAQSTCSACGYVRLDL